MALCSLTSFTAASLLSFQNLLRFRASTWSLSFYFVTEMMTSWDTSFSISSLMLTAGYWNLNSGCPDISRSWHIFVTQGFFPKGCDQCSQHLRHHLCPFLSPWNKLQNLCNSNTRRRKLTTAHSVCSYLPPFTFRSYFGAFWKTF